MSQQRCSRPSRILACWCILTLWTLPTPKFRRFENPRWRWPPSWKKRKIAISQQRFDRSPRSLAWWRTLTLCTICTPKFPHFKNPRWRRPPASKSKYCHMLAVYRPSVTKFGTVSYVDPLDPLTVKKSKFWKSKMAAAVILKSRKIAISHQQCDGSPQNLAPWRRLTLLTLLTVKNLKFWKLKIQHGGMWKYLWWLHKTFT